MRTWEGKKLIEGIKMDPMFIGEVEWLLMQTNGKRIEIKLKIRNLEELLKFISSSKVILEIWNPILQN